MVLVKSAVIAVGLNPFTINHPAITISCTAIGKITRSVNAGEMLLNTDSIAPVNKATAAIKPQTDIHRGMSFD